MRDVIILIFANKQDLPDGRYGVEHDVVSVHVVLVYVWKTFSILWWSVHDMNSITAEGRGLLY